MNEFGQGNIYLQPVSDSDSIIKVSIIPCIPHLHTKVFLQSLFTLFAIYSFADPVRGHLRRGEGCRSIDRLRLAGFILLLQWYVVLLLQDIVPSLRYTDGVLLGLRVRLACLLSRLVYDASGTLLRHDGDADQETPRTLSERLLRATLRDVRHDIQQDRGHQQIRITVTPTTESGTKRNITFPQHSAKSLARYAVYILK